MTLCSLSYLWNDIFKATAGKFFVLSLWFVRSREYQSECSRNQAVKMMSENRLNSERISKNCSLGKSKKTFSQDCNKRRQITITLFYVPEHVYLFRRSVFL